MKAVRVWMLVVVAVAVSTTTLSAKDKPERKGVIIGVVTKKVKNAIFVKAPGDEEARRYVPRWVGGLPKNGGGLEKSMVAQIRKLKVGSRIRLHWSFDERPRAVKIEVLKEPKKD